MPVWPWTIIALGAAITLEIPAYVGVWRSVNRPVAGLVLAVAAVGVCILLWIRRWCWLGVSPRPWWPGLMLVLLVGTIRFLDIELEARVAYSAWPILTLLSVSLAVFGPDVVRPALVILPVVMGPCLLYCSSEFVEMLTGCSAETLAILWIVNLTSVLAVPMRPACQWILGFTAVAWGWALVWLALGLEGLSPGIETGLVFVVIPVGSAVCCWAMRDGLGRAGLRVEPIGDVGARLW